MTRKRTLKIITLFIVILAAISCFISVSYNDIYQDGEWINVQWLGQDIITLLIATPLLFLARSLGLTHQQLTWRIVLTGILLYYAYTYTFFVLGARLTFLYLFHLPIFGLSVIGMFISFLDLFNPKHILQSPSGLVKTIIIGYLLVISLMLTFLWMSEIIAHLTIPGHTSDTPTGDPLLLVYSLDLAIIVPLMIIAAVGYWQRKKYGYKLIGVLLVKTSTLGAALMAMSLSLYIQELIPDWFLMILWCIVGIGGTTLALLFFKQLKEKRRTLDSSVYGKIYAN